MSDVSDDRDLVHEGLVACLGNRYTPVGDQRDVGEKFSGSCTK